MSFPEPQLANPAEGSCPEWLQTHFNSLQKSTKNAADGSHNAPVGGNYRQLPLRRPGIPKDSPNSRWFAKTTSIIAWALISLVRRILDGQGRMTKRSSRKRHRFRIPVT
ncbi:MAG: hypothetical protein KDB14_07670 [Planctomycetales bacterium]|nr:hypothetical protein [Planctomycetales bacterium]